MQRWVAGGREAMAMEWRLGARQRREENRDILALLERSKEVELDPHARAADESARAVDEP